MGVLSMNREGTLLKEFSRALGIVHTSNSYEKDTLKSLRTWIKEMIKSGQSDDEIYKQMINIMEEEHKAAEIEGFIEVMGGKECKRE